MKICVVGDIMIDRYVECKSNRISPEAPVPVVIEEKRFNILGGAGNVYNNLINLGVDTLLCGVVGYDDESIIVKRQLKSRSGIITKNIPTTIKKRIIANGQQVLRIDKEEKAKLDAWEIGHIIKTISNFKPDAIIVSDYNKGVVSRELIDKIKEIDCLLIADPKTNFSLFNGFDTITPNEKEYNDNKYDVNTESILITCGSKGMTLIEGEEKYDINVSSKDVYDVTGAGDTVISVYTYFRLLGHTRRDSAILANRAAGVVVSKKGTTSITLKDIENYV